jgi:hypothetical protein
MTRILMALLIGLGAMPALVAAQTSSPATAIPSPGGEASVPPFVVPVQPAPAESSPSGENKRIDPELFSCPNRHSLEAHLVYPAQAIALNLPRVTIRIYFVVGMDSEIRDIRIGAPNSVGLAFNDTVIAMMKQLRCVNHTGHDQPVTWPSDFELR